MTNLFFTYRFLYLYIINQVICVKGFFYSIRTHKLWVITLNDCPRTSGPDLTCTGYLRTGWGSLDGSRISGRVDRNEFGMSKTQNWVFVMSIETHESGSSAKISFLKTIKICRIDQKSRNRLPDPTYLDSYEIKQITAFPIVLLMESLPCALKIIVSGTDRLTGSKPEVSHS